MEGFHSPDPGSLFFITTVGLALFRGESKRFLLLTPERLLLRLRYYWENGGI